MAAAVREFGRLDMLLDCAGISHRGNFLDLDPGDWDRIIAVNLTGMFHSGRRRPGRWCGRAAAGASST